MAENNEPIKLDLNLEDLDDTNKLLLIRKQPFMDDRYIKHLLRRIYGHKICSGIFYTDSLKIKPKNSSGDEFIGILLNNLTVNITVLGDIVSKITVEFCGPEKDKVVKPKLSEGVFDAVFTDETFSKAFIDPPEPEDPTTPPKDWPEYLRVFPVCPNIALDILNRIFVENYTDLLRNIMIRKSQVYTYSDEIADETIFRNYKLLHTIYSEIETLSPLEKDCSICAIKGEC